MVWYPVFLIGPTQPFTVTLKMDFIHWIGLGGWMTMTCPSGNLLDHINMIVFGGHKTVPTLLCGLRGHIPVPTKSVNVGMPTVRQSNKTDTGKRQNTAVRNTEPPRP